MARNYRRIAMLIDGDNAQASLIEKMLVETTKYGEISIRRIYGDWTESNMNQWKTALHSHAIQPIQQFRNTVGKNATDSALIIDAMDLLHSDRVDSFCIVSSDSDYTRLATRIREEGMFVIGIGKQMTPAPFVDACNVFVRVEDLEKEDNLTVVVPKVAPNAVSKTETPKASKKPIATKPDPLPLLIKAFQTSSQENGWVLLSTLGTVLQQLKPGFDTGDFGRSGLGKLLRDFPNHFQVHEDGNRVRYIGKNKNKSQ